ncbi:MAG: lysophospholipid acyltransferase family protein [Chloroflexota bacterium]
MTAWLTGRVAYSGIWFGIAVGRLAVRVLPRRWLFGFADCSARICFNWFKGFRTRSIRNITAAFGERLSSVEIEDLARKSLKNFFRDVIEMGVVLGISDDELRRLIPMVGREHLDGALAKGAGVLVLSAHLGNFFLLGSRLAVEGYAISVLVNQPADSHLAKLMDRYRLEVRQRTIHARPRREALKKLYAALRANESAVIIADEYRQSSGILVPLFGKKVVARRGPATVALRTGAAVIPICMVRQADQSLKMIIEPELELDRSGKSMRQVRENTIRITQWLERTVLQHPEQWNWMNIRKWAAEEADAASPGETVRQAS